VLPVPAALVKLVGEHDHVVTLEDGVREGGVGSALALRARDAGIASPVQAFGVPRRFLDHAARDELLTTLRLTPPDIARDVLTALGATP
jgi:1-deoxy-D-xylulose-5-phosphate synthase